MTLRRDTDHTFSSNSSSNGSLVLSRRVWCLDSGTGNFETSLAWLDFYGVSYLADDPNFS